MSRIHEALKKAEQERSTIQAASGGVLTNPLSVDTAAATVSAPDAEARRSPLPTEQLLAHTAGYLRFEDLRKHCAHPQWHLDPSVNVFINSALTVHGSEQFRTLRSRLYQMRASQSLRTLLVTSSIPSEGKTFVTNNLAQAIVRQPDRRALIIDADLRCSRLHVPLGAPASPGLTDYLRERVLGVLWPTRPYAVFSPRNKHDLAARDLSHFQFQFGGQPKDVFDPQLRDQLRSG